ncbi:S1 family peptidase [Alkalicoccus urumqiensis]|uniref:Serine protease n=1 Tax=Alkalicoccus urumqiensis TaxID=1548213 RepID=A0A2P6MKT4_ALKUR|nr:serine protease [Alkalicoccus urumqiensis]PRO66894.1 serine protease [Alkalicoccus urumqiensis]
MREHDEDNENTSPAEENTDINQREGGESEVEEKRPPEEPLYFDGENYLTKEEFFNPPPEEEVQPEKKPKRWLKIAIASLAALALLVNVFAVWPQLFNFPAAEFLANANRLNDDPVIEEYKESIVVVRTEASKGTGFVIGDGLIMTNEHVIDDGSPVSVHFEDGTSYRVEAAASDETLDLAVLEAEGDSFDHPALSLEPGWDPGEEMYVIGNPMFFNFIPNEGTFLEETSSGGRDQPVAAINAPVYRGSSGSPVITENGSVAAIVYATSTRPISGEDMRVGLAVRAEEAVTFLEASGLAISDEG